jgi:hypothetical protein
MNLLPSSRGLLFSRPTRWDGTILAIYHALQRMKGYSTFASFGKRLCCDFFVPAQSLVICTVAVYWTAMIEHPPELAVAESYQ